MMMRRVPFTLPALTAAFLAASAPAALACACCAEPGYRLAENQGLKARHMAEIGQLRFAKPVKMMVGMREPDKRIRGIKDAGEDYALTVTRAADLLTFALKDDKGRPGSIAIRMPATISIFEVDPHTGSDKGLGPVLYKEWKVTAHNVTGDGLFKAAVTRNSRVTLVLHGRGNACTSADQFHAWTLQLTGPASRFTLTGKLDQAR